MFCASFRASWSLTDIHILQQIFQQVEEESERRAQQDAANQITDPSELYKSEALTATRPKNRRRGSISITRFGQVRTNCHVLLDVT